eukprot:TRINITY_DN16315_c0_g1_i1.p1 TRINITY_DN16315_c0_g1~~TRINITY_DN16315_c0_g1_i1.p1  ORF type:complete len:802 (+),score=199.00 TRINITY_DN16315_c0_g1_i1:332-2407(+)
MGNTVLYLELADSKYHVPIQDCFRKSRGRDRTNVVHNTPASAGLTPNSTPGTSNLLPGGTPAADSLDSQPIVIPSMGDSDGVLKARFRAKFPFVDFQIYFVTEAMLSKEVSGQTTISLAGLYTDRGRGGQISRTKYSVWYVKGKHRSTVEALRKYYAGIPEIPSSCLKEPKEVGTVTVSVELVNPFCKRPLNTYLTPYTQDEQLRKNPFERGEAKPASVVDDVEDQIYRILRAYERLCLHVKSVPYCIEHIVVPLLWWYHPLHTLLSMAIIAFTCLYTPLWAVPLDVFFLFLFLSLLSKGQSPMNCIVWPDDERLKEPPGTPHTIFGQYYYARTLLVKFVRLVERLVDHVEILSSLFDFTEPIATLSIYGVVFGFLSVACAALWVVTTAGDYFEPRAVVCFMVLVPYYRGGYKNLKQKYKAGEFARPLRRARRARRCIKARMAPLAARARPVAAFALRGAAALAAACWRGAWALIARSGFIPSGGDGSATSSADETLQATPPPRGAEDCDSAKASDGMESCASSDNGDETGVAAADDEIIDAVVKSERTAQETGLRRRQRSDSTSSHSRHGHPMSVQNASMHSCEDGRGGGGDDESEDSGIDQPDPDAFDLEEFIDRVEDAFYAHMRELFRRLAVIFEKVPTVPEKQHRYVASFQQYPIPPHIRTTGPYVPVPLPHQQDRPRHPARYPAPT